jgi:hypothetical protein
MREMAKELEQIAEEKSETGKFSDDSTREIDTSPIASCWLCGRAEQFQLNRLQITIMCLGLERIIESQNRKASLLSEADRQQPSRVLGHVFDWKINWDF